MGSQAKTMNLNNLNIFFFWPEIKFPEKTSIHDFNREQI